MNVRYIDYVNKEMMQIKCTQVIFTLDKNNAFCLKNDNESIKDALRIPKSDIQMIFE